MKTIYFVRHGQSEANAGKTYQGAGDPLTEEGKKQALIVAERCTRLPVDVIISSTMDRAHDTALAIAARIGKNIELSDEFVERIAPTHLVERKERDEEGRRLYEVWIKSLFSAGVKDDDGENFTEINTRAKRALDILEKRSESNILVVTHGFFLRVMLARAIFGTSLTPEELFKVDRAIPHTKNTHITVFKFDENDQESPWKLWVWNDHAHLG